MLVPQKIQRQTTHLRNYKLCKLVQNMLLLHLFKSNHRSVAFQKVRFSESFPASRRINQRKNAKIYMSLFLTRVEVLTSAPHLPLLAVRAFLLSCVIRFWLYLSQCEVERTGLASWNHNFITPLNSHCVGYKTTVAVFPARHKHVMGTQPANQLAS